MKGEFERAWETGSRTGLFGVLTKWRIRSSVKYESKKVNTVHVVFELASGQAGTMRDALEPEAPASPAPVKARGETK